MITDDIIHIVYRDIFNPVLFLSLSPSFSADKFKNGRILTSQIVFRLKPLCLVKRRQDKTVFKWRRANISLISWSEYSSCKCVTLYLDLFYLLKIILLERTLNIYFFFSLKIIAFLCTKMVFLFFLTFWIVLSRFLQKCTFITSVMMWDVKLNISSVCLSFDFLLYLLTQHLISWSNH